MIIHSLILFSFLSVFFFMYISKLSKSLFDHEITSLMADKLADVVSPEYKAQITANFPIDKIKAHYEEEDKTVAALNRGLAFTIFYINVICWMFLIISLIILTRLGVNLKIKHVVIENIMTFTLVGIIEFLFFKFIASKFVPVEPSFISKEFLRKIQAAFS